MQDVDEVAIIIKLMLFGHSANLEPPHVSPAAMQVTGSRDR